MQNEDNDCIRYLMKEMDPSEELLMERAMMEDENLLIEVESMRQTFKKLDQLPQMNPPSDVRNNILQQASEHAGRRHTGGYFKPLYKYAVAATLALTFTAGGLWYYTGEEIKSNPSSPMTEESLGSFGLTNDAFILNELVQQASANETNVEPWVDRNDVLHFNSQRSDDDFEAILQSSTQKLQLIENSITRSQRPNPIQLTGSGN